MMNDESESGFELVFDNRKLIVAFAVLIAICACCYVLGFREGKHQGLQEGSQAAAEPQSKLTSERAQVQSDSDKPARLDSRPKSQKQDSADQHLDWYKNVNSREAEPATIPVEPSKRVPAPVPAKPAMEKPRPHPESVTYSLQVGAFSQKAALDAAAHSLQAKGFAYRIEPPQAGGQLYHLLVGKFHTRAEAAAIKLRLQKDGFSSFIKTTEAGGQ